MFEEEEKYNLTSLNLNTVATEGIFFYKPVTGIISSHYDLEKRHLGVDLAAPPRASVLATLDGIVIYTGYDQDYGNVITLQHKNGFVSIYKHNEVLLKGKGDMVVAGEVIALVGSTGELSTGPHLHFELWNRGTSINPEEYIAF
jgi:lipoprotein NlpD